MESQDNMLSFMDMLDLDEELIDERLKAIMDRSNHTVKHLSSALHLLQYKQLVNIKENSDCENDAECDFAAKVIGNVSEENINYVCDIVRITLSLSSETLVIKAEHLLQQIMSDLIVPHDSKDTSEGSENVAVLKLKISDSILEAVIKRNVKLNLPFLELPVSGILKGSDEKLKIHFLTTTVPKLFEGVCGFNILDKIWQFVKEIKSRNAGLVLLILSSLSEYFLPVPDTTGTISFVSKIVYEYEFWNNVLRGLSSDEASLRKMSIYLAKRAVDCVYSLNKNVSVKHENLTLFRWNYVDKINLKQLWDNYFTLVDSLEEKQSNIVLPSLQLFGTLRLLDCWLVCAFKLGLRHDNTQVRMKCIQHRLNVILKSEPEAKALLEALNDINLYENQTECDELKKRMKAYLSDENIFTCVFTSMPTIKWSPVPLYHISTILAEINFAEFVTTMPDEQVPKYIIDILSVSCNNVAVREAVYVNISHFLGNCCLNLSWQHLLGICIMHPNIFCNTSSYNPLKSLFTRKFIKNDKEKKVFFQMLFETHLYVDFALLYLEYHGTDVQTFLEVLLDKTTKIDDITNKENSDVSEYLQDVIYLAKLFNKTKNTRLTMFKTINEIVLLSYKTILNYILRLILNKTVLSFNEIIVLSDAFHSMSISINNAQLKEPMLRLYKEFILIIKDKNSVLETKVLTIYMIHSLTMNPVLKENYQLELLTLNDVIILTEAFEKTPSIGRLKNLFYEKSCAIVDYILKEDDSNKVEHIVRITAYIENVVECGGYGCLKFCLNIMNTILGDVLENPNINYDLTKFIDKMWNEIEELRTNSQYNPCIEEFIKLITNESLLRTPKYNNTIELYCMKIVNFGTIKTSPLFYLVKRLNNITISLEHGLIIYVLSEVLLYAPVPRKDQRILDNLAISVLNDPKYNFVNEPLDIRFNFQIQYLSIPMLMKLTEQDIIESIDIFIRNRINEVFANKLRYHGHSQAHRTLLTGLQHLLMIFTLKCGNCGDTLNWCIDLLGKLPHQPSVRTCLEWYIALHAFVENNSLNEELAKRIEKLPTVSQFLILFWIAKRKILDNTCSEEEFDFVMNHLLSHTMGQMFNIRLHAQYLASKLHSLHDLKSSKYEYTINVIEKTFVESAKDKNFVKLKNDYFVNNFDIITNLTPCFIYYFLPRYCEINNNEAIDLTFVKDVMKDVSSTIANLEFYKKYTGQINDEDVFNLDICKESNGNADDDIEASGTIQKKYVPWRNMSDVNVYGAGKKKESTSELVVVASLIDKLPNLGGMARTSEVFGVKTYVVDSLRHLQDKQFQGLSVSAERWIDVKEVRPGSALKQYLLQMKAEGYSIVAAEQTSNSVKLQSFKFPKKTLLLLGHEKEGIPCDLLPLMDFCVEIPQQGFIRSLNVHVTAAIFVWEYTRQNIL